MARTKGYYKGNEVKNTLLALKCYSQKTQCRKDDFTIEVIKKGYSGSDIQNQNL